MDLIQWTLIGCAGATAVVLLCYYLILFNKLNISKIEKSSELPPVSVIIAARNARRQLEANLSSVLEQNYPQFEVVVVNDGSYDGTKDLLRELNLQHAHLKVVQLDIEDQYRKGKKFALTMGIKAARYDQLLFTDADCKPTSANWIRAMMEARASRPIVLGYAPLHTRPTPVGAMAYYETVHTGIQYLSYALAGMPYMGVGRNLSYTKDLFFKNKGFASHQHLISGDDDLFIQEVANKENVSICTDPESFMYSDAPRGLGAYVRQKIRHLSASSVYRPQYKWMLGIYSLSHLLFYASVAAGLVFPESRLWSASILAGKWLIQWPVFFGASRKLNARYVAFLLPIYDLYHTAYLFLFTLLKPFSKPRSWN